MFSKLSVTNNSSTLLTNQDDMAINYRSCSSYGSYTRALELNNDKLYSIDNFNLIDFTENKIYMNYIMRKSPNANSILLERRLVSLAQPSFTQTRLNSTSQNLVNVNFLRKERLYTKLKYSRSPAYDIVSGGSAALLAAFLGFLISEKYGFEMVDSGDFYFVFMYAVFLSFSVRPLLVTLSSNSSASTIFSVKPVLTYFLNLFYFLVNKLK